MITVPSVCCWCPEAQHKPALLPATISQAWHFPMELMINIPGLNWPAHTSSLANHCCALQNYDSESHGKLYWIQICLLVRYKTYYGDLHAVCRLHTLHTFLNYRHIQLLNTRHTSCTVSITQKIITRVTHLWLIGFFQTFCAHN